MLQKHTLCSCLNWMHTFGSEVTRRPKCVILYIKLPPLCFTGRTLLSEVMLRFPQKITLCFKTKKITFGLLRAKNMLNFKHAIFQIPSNSMKPSFVRLSCKYVFPGLASWLL